MDSVLFSDLHDQFKTDTGLEAKTNPDTYIQYVQARILEEMLKQQTIKMNELIDAVRSNI